jgi:hypothetical protein
MAIALDLIPDDTLVDRRNGEARLFQIEARDANIELHSYLPEYEQFGLPRLPRIDRPSLPWLGLDPPTVPQPYQVEIWAEKATIDDVLLPLAVRYKVNIQTGVGEVSATRCRDLVNRVEAHERPVRILYVSDFDPGGQSMPVAVARKIEFELYRRELDLDIQVRPIVLTHEQCVEYQLPRIPLKETERRAEAFEKRFGEGATELDALEAIHPGLLARILREEIRRYWDPDHHDRVEETLDDIRNQLGEINNEAANHPEVVALMAEFDEIKAKHDAWCERTEATLKAELAEIAGEREAWIERAKPVWQEIRNRLDENAPNINDIEWDEAGGADEDPDPLFDSTRDYIEQIDRYKEFQDKPTTRRRRDPTSTGAAKKRAYVQRKTTPP